MHVHNQTTNIGRTTMTANVEIIVGTYEDFLVGYKLELKNDKLTLKQSFADKSHSGALKCATAQGNWVASGGTDDRIFIYDMRTRKQVQIILAHTGTVNALAFTPDATHILSGGDDGVMTATRINNWTTDGTWPKAHSGTPITHISCHPSGKLALSLGKDLVLRTWNLVKGRVAYKTNLKGRNTLGLAPECLAWSTNGEYFSLSGQRIVEIWSIKTAEVVRSHKTPAKPICLTWIDDIWCLVGLENGTLLWLSASDDNEDDAAVKTVEAHKSRVKGISYLNNTLVTAASDGELKVWNVKTETRALKIIASTNIGCRPTCIDLLNLEQFGENYALNQTALSSKQQQQDSQQTQLDKPKKILPRSVVTIEYENENDETAIATTTKKNVKVEKKKTGKKRKVLHEQSTADNSDSEDTEEEEDEELDSDSDTDSVEDESSDEPAERLPKSKKLQLNKKQQKQKKLSVDTKTKLNKVRQNSELKVKSKLKNK